MIIDIRELPHDAQLQADVCIVGGGAAGITAALQFLDTDVEVLVLESGGMAAEPQTQSLYDGSVADERLHSPPDRYRQRRFGGTTTIWGGRCMPFDPIDFEPRAYVPHSGWPLEFADLAPYYPAANRLCEAGDFAYSADKAFTRPVKPMIAGFTAEHFSSNTLERFSCPTDFGARYGHKLRRARNIKVLLHANVTSLQLDAAGARVAAVKARDLEGARISVQAREFVLATGGIETARLLLASNDVQQHGIGNEHDLVGRFYMCHLAGTIGALRIDRPLTDVWNGYDISDEGVYCRRRLALTPAVQRELGIGNFVARLHHPRITAPEHRNAILSLLFLAKFVIPYEYGKRLHGGEKASLHDWLQHIRNVVTGPFDAAGFAWHMLRDRRLAERKFPSIIIKPKANLYSIDFHAEQEPNSASRVSLSAEPDALGVPRVHVDWRYTPGDLATVSRALALLKADVQATALGSFDYDPAEVEFEMTRYGAYGGHHIGTARMGIDPRTSVVDRDLRIHGVENLYVASAATFPTSSQANPTLTVVALTLRLADLLRRKLAADRASVNAASPTITARAADGRCA